MENYSVVITGGNKGLGAEISTSILTGTSWDVISISRTPTTLDPLSKNPRYKEYLYDFSNLTDLDIFCKEIFYTHNVIGLVNNAAIAYDEIVTNASANEINHMLTVNCIAPTIMTKWMIRSSMIHKGDKSIVNIGSVSAHTGYKGLSMYGGSKGYLSSFSTAIAREWGTKGVRINTIAAGFMDTDMSAKLSQDQKKRIANRTSKKSMLDISEVAQTTLFLLKSESSAITGTTIHVDNGTL
jgi:3-oxoacyl-[acyl-carrier protein] reductase